MLFDFAPAVWAALSLMMVACRDGVKRQLGKTFLLLNCLEKVLLESLPILSIPEGIDYSWLFLRTLGVTVDYYVNIYLWCLKSLTNRPSATLDDIKLMYELIQKHQKDDEETVR